MKTLTIESTDKSMKLDIDVNINEQCTEAYFLMHSDHEGQIGSIPVESEDLRKFCKNILNEIGHLD